MSTDHLDNENFTDFEKSCPLCMELFDLDDMGFLPCPCGYRICRFCWHRLKTYEDNIEAGFEDQDGSASSGRCPACRQIYSDVPAGFDSTLSAMLDSNKYKKKKKRLLNKQKQKLQEEKQKLKEILKRDEKSLAGLRVVQKNLVFVIGIQQRTHDELRKEFSKFGKIHKLVVSNTNNTNLNTAYVTFVRPDDAIKAIQALNQGCTSLNSQLILNGQSKLMNKTAANNATRPTQGILKASLGTTKYCNHWLKNLQCPKLPDCMYLHELADPEASFTKEDMQKNRHCEYEKKLIQEYLDKNLGKTEDDCELTDNHNNLKNSNNSENSNSSSSIDNLGLSNNTAENQLNDEDSLIFNLGRKFDSTNLTTTESNSKTVENDSLVGGVNQIKSHVTNTNGDLKNDNQLLFGKLIQHGQLVSSSNENEKCTTDLLISKDKLNNICINHSSSSYIDAQQLLKIDDSHNSITGSNNLINNNSLNGGAGLLLSSSNNSKSKCINIDNSKTNNNKLRMNLIDEIIANSSDSSTTSYSTCSSGSNRLNQTDLNEFSNILLTNGEHLKSFNSMDNSNKLNTYHSPINSNNLINSLEDDGLDFDPISISTIGLQDLLKTSTMNNTNIINQNSNTANTLNQLLFGQTPPQQPIHHLNQLNQLNQTTSNLTNLNGTLHNAQHQPKAKSTFNQSLLSHLTSDRSNLFGNNSMFVNSSNNNSISSLNSNNPLVQTSQQASNNLDPNDTWRNSLRALLPNVNITFSNSSSSSSNQQQPNTLNNLNNQNNQTINPQNLLFKQQQQQISQSVIGQLNQQPIKQQQSNFSQNTIKNNQNFLNQLQQQQNNQMPPQQSVYPPLAFLHQQQLLLRQQAAAGLNLQFANTNFFNQQQMKPNQIQQPSSSSSQQINQTAVPQLQHNLGNLQRFFPQGFHHQEHAHQAPPGFNLANNFS